MAGNDLTAVFTLSDLGLAAVVGVVAVVPATLAFLAIAAGLRAARVEERLGETVHRVLAGGLALGVAVASALLAWTWGGATHLKPRCLARAEPVYATAVYADGARGVGPGPVGVASLLVDAPDYAASPPRWAGALLGPQGFAYYEWRRGDGTLARVARDGTVTPVASSGAGAVLRVNRATGRSSYWSVITVERFTVVETLSGTVIAEGEEMWIDAGPARYRCGIASGPLPVAGRDYPAGDGLLRFLEPAVRPVG